MKCGSAAEELQQVGGRVVGSVLTLGVGGSGLMVNPQIVPDMFIGGQNGRCLSLTDSEDAMLQVQTFTAGTY